MPSEAKTVEFHILLKRIRPVSSLEAPGFTLIIQARDADHAIQQAEEFAKLTDKFRVVDIYPASDRPDHPVV